jgi:hypothetical protein
MRLFRKAPPIPDETQVAFRVANRFENCRRRPGNFRNKSEAPSLPSVMAGNSSADSATSMLD